MKNNPLDKLDEQELVWFFGILKDACRERLEKNLISQMLEERLYRQHGPVVGRLDPRAKLKQWEPRYRKFLAVATEMQELTGAAETGALAQLFAQRFAAPRKRARKPGTAR